jgi:hypothetical protein
MRTLIGIAALALVAGAIAIWSVSGSHSNTGTAVARGTLAPSIPSVSKDAALSILEIHNQAHLDNLPVQEIDDKTLVFTASSPR